MSKEDKEGEEETELIEADDEDRVSCVIQRVLITPKEETTPSNTVYSRQDALSMARYAIS